MTCMTSNDYSLSDIINSSKPNSGNTVSIKVPVKDDCNCSPVIRYTCSSCRLLKTARD